MTPAEFDQRRAWLDELLSRPHLWPWQVVQVQALAEELGVQVVIWDRPLDWNWAVGEWRPRTRMDEDGRNGGNDATVV